jgi:hypothetical protein
MVLLYGNRAGQASPHSAPEGAGGVRTSPLALLLWVGYLKLVTLCELVFAISKSLASSSVYIAFWRVMIDCW